MFTCYPTHTLTDVRILEFIGGKIHTDVFEIQKLCLVFICTSVFTRSSVSERVTTSPGHFYSITSIINTFTFSRWI